MDEMRTIRFRNIQDMNLEHVFECGQCFRWVPAPDGSGDYIGAAGKYAARISLERGDEIDNAELVITATGGSDDFWRDYFDLDTDYGAVKEKLITDEPGIRDAAEYGYGIRILNQDLFETLISFIISQNNNIPRIRKNIESLCSRYGERIGDAFGREWYAFPEPEVLADACVSDLADLRLGYRAEYIRTAADHFLEDREHGNLPAAREEILRYHGVGPKVANCIMLFGLRDVSAFPIDTWVKHIMNDMYGFDESDMKGMQHFAHEKFGNLAGYAQQYLFYYYRDKGAR